MINFSRSYQPEINSFTRKIDLLNESKEPNQTTLSIYQTDLMYYQRLEKRRLQMIALKQKIQSELSTIESQSIQSASKIASEMNDFSSAVTRHGKNAKDVFQGVAGDQHYTVIQKLIYDNTKAQKKVEGLFNVCF